MLVELPLKENSSWFCLYEYLIHLCTALSHLSSCFNVISHVWLCSNFFTVCIYMINIVSMIHLMNPANVTTDEHDDISTEFNLSDFFYRRKRRRERKIIQLYIFHISTEILIHSETCLNIYSHHIADI